MTADTSMADDGLDAAITALNPEHSAHKWRHGISCDLEYTLSELVENWPSIGEDDELLAAIRMLLRRDPSGGRIVSQSAVHEACVAVLRAILQVHAEDGGNCLSYGAVLDLDTASSGAGGRGPRGRRPRPCDWSRGGTADARIASCSQLARERFNVRPPSPRTGASGADSAPALSGDEPTPAAARWHRRVADTPAEAAAGGDSTFSG